MVFFRIRNNAPSFPLRNLKYSTLFQKSIFGPKIFSELSYQRKVFFWTKIGLFRQCDYGLKTTINHVYGVPFRTLRFFFVKEFWGKSRYKVRQAAYMDHQSSASSASCYHFQRNTVKILILYSHNRATSIFKRIV